MHVTKIHLNSGRNQIFHQESRNLLLEENAGAWIEGALKRNRSEILPEPWAAYSATATDFQGGLVVSVYSGESEVLVQTIAIARHAAHGRSLWRVVSALASQPDDGDPPGKTWCAVLEHGSAPCVPELEDFALASAWFWKRHGSKFTRRAMARRNNSQPIFQPSGDVVNQSMPMASELDVDHIFCPEMDTRPEAISGMDSTDHLAAVNIDANAEDEFLMVEVPHDGGNIQMKVPRALLKLCFSIDAADRSVDCINRNLPLFVEAAFSEYEAVCTFSFELTEFHIAGAQRNMARLGKSADGSAPFA